ncbi:MAG: LpxI family protein [Pedosphaera sp.]|nr:LpxI family protein [Pedosphaera sp.]
MIGLIAGSKSLPLLFAREALRDGRKVIAVAFEGETDPAIEKVVEETIWLRVGQLGKMIRAFTDRGVKQCVMLGQIAPKNLFSVRPDLRAASLLFRLKEKNAHSIFGAIADELQQDGVQLIEPIPWLRPWMPGAGYRTGPKIGRQELDAIAYGFRIAKELSRLDIGQSVVVKDGTTLSVEGFEGTDACLQRGGDLAGTSGGAVAVKVAKTNHDLRFDIPCLGPRTVEICANSGIRVLAFEPDKTLLLDQPELEVIAGKLRVTVCTATGS